MTTKSSGTDIILNLKAQLRLNLANDKAHWLTKGIGSKVACESLWENKMQNSVCSRLLGKNFPFSKRTSRKRRIVNPRKLTATTGVDIKGGRKETQIETGSWVISLKQWT